MFRAAEFREAESPEVTFHPCAAEALGLCEPDAPVAADAQPAEREHAWYERDGALGLRDEGRRREDESEEEEESFTEFEEDDDEELDDEEEEELYEDDADDDDDDVDEAEEEDE